MKLTHLRAFVTIADSSGFSRAAARLNLTQPTASRQVAALEAELGVRLFERLGPRVRLTSEGEDLLWRSRRVLSDIASIGERAHALKGGQIGTLRVNATPQVIESFLAPFLAQFFRRHPGVEVQLLESGGERQRIQLERSEVDLALMGSGAERLQGRALYPIHVLAVISAKHRFSRRATVAIEEIADEPLLLLSRDFGSRSWFDAACSFADVQPRILLESSSPATLMALAEIGSGIAIIPSNVHALRGRVRALPLVFDGQSIGKWSMIAWNPRRPLAPYAVHFIEEIAGRARRSYPGRELIRRAPAIPRPKEAAG